MDQLILKLPDALTALAKAGPWGVAAAALLAVAMIWASIKYRQMVQDAQNEKQQKDQAGNAGTNAKADQDAAKAQDDIEKTIAGKDT